MPPAADNLRRMRMRTIAIGAPSESLPAPNAMLLAHSTDRLSVVPSCIGSAELLDSLEPPCSKLSKFCNSDVASTRSNIGVPPVNVTDADPGEADTFNTGLAPNYQNDLQAKLPDNSNDLQTICTERVDGLDVVGRSNMSAGVDELLIREMMQNLEQAIAENAHSAEDLSSCSSSPTSNTNSCAKWINLDGEQMSTTADSSVDEECFDIFLADSSASIDEEIQRLLQQAEDQALLDIYPIFTES